MNETKSSQLEFVHVIAQGEAGMPVREVLRLEQLEAVARAAATSTLLPCERQHTGRILKAPAQVLSRVEHRGISQALQDALPTGRTYTGDCVWRQYQRVYADYPKYLKSIQQFFIE